MPELPIPIIAGDKTKFDTDYHDAIPVNMLAVKHDVLGSLGYLISHDGVSQLVTGQGIDRGAFYNDRMGRSFRVSGQKLIEIIGNSVNVIGNIPGTDQVRMDYSFNSLLIVASGRAFLYTGIALTEIIDPDLGSPIDGWWIDGYYMFTDGEYIYHTDITNESSIDPLKFATSEISPDKTLAGGKTQDNLAIVFNRYSTEYFINEASEQFAFSRLTQKAVNSGIVGPRCWCDLGGNIFILGGSKGEPVALRILAPGQVISVTTRTVGKIIASYAESDLYSCRIESRTENEDRLIYIHLPNKTLLYNHTIAEQMGKESAWSELRTGQSTWRCINGVRDPKQNKWVYGDKIDSRIGYLDSLTAAQYGQPVHSEFYTPMAPIDSMSVDSIEVNTIPGNSSSIENMFVSTTRDGAHYSQEWSNEESVPEIYDDRFIVRRLGYVRKKIGFKFRSLNKGKINASGAVITYA